MANIRVIARLDVKGPNLIKGIHLEGLRVVGDPSIQARQYYHEGIDEILYMDTVASLYGRNSLIDIVRYTANDVFVPMTVGGGVRSIEDFRTLLRAGADKVAINTAATQDPDLLRRAAESFGSQCVVLSIEAKRVATGRWEVLTNHGRDHTGMDVVEWAKRGAALGAGEILLTSVDNEGTKKGCDTDLAQAVTCAVSIPVILSGGVGKKEHLAELLSVAPVSAIAVASLLHFKLETPNSIKTYLLRKGYEVRVDPEEMIHECKK